MIHVYVYQVNIFNNLFINLFFKNYLLLFIFIYITYYCTSTINRLHVHFIHV